MGKALYRKYRPKTLSEVVGQEQVTDILANSLKQGKISHAYLFVGPRGTGKTSVARIFAHEINGFPYELEDDYVDIIEIDGASNRGIDDIRELREKAAIAPSEGKFKVYIIDEVHMLTPQAFNALLKTLEEPPEHVVFMMATTDVHKVPRTILSRTQNFNFKLAKPETMRGFLRKVSDAEGIEIADDAIEVVRRQGGGSFRDSLSLLDQVSALSEAEITRDLVVAAMGLPEDEEVEKVLEAYSRGDLNEIAEVLRGIFTSGTKPELLTEGMIRKIMAEPRPEWLGLLARLPEVAAPFSEAKMLVALTRDLATKPVVMNSAAARPVAAEKPTATKQTAANPSVQPATEPVEMTAEKPTNEPKIESKTEPEAKSPVMTTIDFNWSDFKTKVQEQNDAVARQLDKCRYEFDKGVLDIFPEKKIVRTILARDKNMDILRSVASGIKIVVHEVGDAPESAKNDPQKASLSDIMGGEVIEDGGESPF